MNAKDYKLISSSALFAGLSQQECGRLLESTSEPTLRAILERVILDEFRTSQDLDEAIQRDPAFEPVTSFSALTAYMKSRNSILSFLGEHGIHYSAMFLYGRLYSIASEAGVHNALDFYEKVVTERQELKGLREEEQKHREDLEKEHQMQKAMLAIKEKYGKNAILTGTSLEEGATTRERNRQIGGHKA